MSVAKVHLRWPDAELQVQTSRYVSLADYYAASDSALPPGLRGCLYRPGRCAGRRRSPASPAMTSCRATNSRRNSSSWVAIGKRSRLRRGTLLLRRDANHTELRYHRYPREYVPGIPSSHRGDLALRHRGREVKAAYGAVHLACDRPLSLTIGGRYTRDDRSATATRTTPGRRSYLFRRLSAPIFEREIGAHNNLSFQQVQSRRHD